MEYSNELRLWLLDTAALRSGFSEEGRFTEVTLEQLIPPAHRPYDLQLGFFAQLAKLLSPGLFSEIEHSLFINPNNWFEIVQIYLHVVHVALPDIARKSDEVRNNYLGELVTLQKTLETNVQVLDRIGYTEALWFQLVDQYSSTFILLATTITHYSQQEDSADKKALLRLKLDSVLQVMQQKYMQLVGFFHLIDLAFAPLKEPRVVTDLKIILNQFFDSSAQSCDEQWLPFLMKRIHPELWKEPFEGYLPEHFTLDDLKKHIRDSLEQNPIRQQMQQARKSIKVLKDSFRAEVAQLNHKAVEAQYDHFSRLTEDLSTELEITRLLLSVEDAAPDEERLMSLEQDIAATQGMLARHRQSFFAQQAGSKALPSFSLAHQLVPK